MAMFKELGPKIAIIIFLLIMAVGALFSLLTKPKAFLIYLAFLGITILVLIFKITLLYSFYLNGSSTSFNLQFVPALKEALYFTSFIFLFWGGGIVVLWLQSLLEKDSS